MSDRAKNQEKLKILIAGGAGYLGGYLTDLLIKNGCEVTVYDNLLYEDRYLKPANFIYGDVRDSKKLLSIINGFDAVVWLAAIVGDGACAVEPYYTRAINVDSVKWLAENYKGKIIFTSTCSVYGFNNNLIDETSELIPLSLYAETKVAAEKLIINQHKNYLIFRLGTLFGVGDDHSRLRFDLVVNSLTMKAARGEVLKVFGGGQWRPLLHVKDAAEAIVFAIKNDLSGIYNLSNKNFMIKDVAEEIQNTLNSFNDSEVKIEYTNLKFEDLRNYKVSADKFKEFGWRPKHELASGIKEIYQRVKESRVKEPDHPLYSNAIFIKRKFF
ncbi:MAG: hypothetical protein A3H63_02305 [Candidatus Harrisonbacteria bacterium RIFCSPLOWO2_02_FULL_45_10c]|uniref:NAD-dependent epimerase/dehydratase domain-containing protein n=1 Tax=Candidatus Harrisonbacteria bacterium RIFCSPLOWO2_02_FULL_45_10c TaxID=1798410 RepID=A0A1G1ZSI1_9BACT|nr:MAG: hypothetical protein A3H63_02305 [Candidatus Harrisonbacteria bacterium RIFCSPLOWO2_02_FULL_45_10c]